MARQLGEERGNSQQVPGNKRGKMVDQKVIKDEWNDLRRFDTSGLFLKAKYCIVHLLCEVASHAAAASVFGEESF